MNPGWEWDYEDWDALRDTDVPFALSAADIEDREDFDPRGIIRLDNQGAAPSCVGHGLTHCGEGCFWMATGEVREFSRMFAWLESQRGSGLYGRNGGATISAAEKVATSIGFVDESEMEYEPKYPRFAARRDTGPLDALRPKAEPFRIARASTLRSYDALRTSQATNQGPVLLGMGWSRDTLRGDEVNRYRLGKSGHCVFAWGGMWRGGDLWVWVGNSHNDGWTLTGPGFWDDWFRHQRNAARLLSDMREQRPRRIDWIKENPFR